MATITEDYVSFETAKLLKEKGFNERLLTLYITDEAKKEGCFQIMAFTDDKIDNNHSDHCYLAPTLQMVMKWLREVYNVFISISIGNHKEDNRDTSMPDFVYYFFYITDTKAVYEEEKQCHKEFSTFEEACEGAIKYCLNNII